MDVLELRAPRRYRLPGLIASTALAAVVVGIAFLSLPAALISLIPLVPVTWALLPMTFGSRTARLGPDGVRTRIYPWDRRSTRVPWDDVSTAWIAAAGRYRYLHLGLRDPRSYVTGGPFRRMALQGLLDTHGTPVLVYLPDGDEPALAYVTARGVEVTDTRPHRPDLVKPSPAAVTRRVYRASPRNLVFPALLLPVCVGLAALPFAVGLLSLATPAIALAVFTVFTVTRLRGRTVVDGTGFTVDGVRLPWDDITEVQLVTVGPLRSVRLLRPRLGPLVAHGLVDQPLADPRYPGRVAEVAAACAGRVEAGPRRQSAWLTAAFPLILVVTITAAQFSLVDRPWRDSPWWPGLDIATSTADPCRALSTDVAARLVPDARPRHVYGTASGSGRMCRMGTGAPNLEVTITREIMDDLVAEARESYAREARTASADTPVPGLGLVGGSSALVVEVVARRGNVVVQVQFRADADSAPGDATRADVVEVARAAVGSVTLR